VADAGITLGVLAGNEQPENTSKARSGTILFNDISS
jgi:hypothetical protein